MVSVTITDIARRLKISPQSVSVALHERSSSTRISPELRERVRRTAAEMGYRPHLVARALKRQPTGLFTITCSVFRSAFFSEAIMAVEDEVRAAGFVLCVLHPEEDRPTADNLVYQISDAVLHLSNWTSPPGLEHMQTPCIAVFTSSPPARPIPYYYWEDASAAELIAARLHSEGHRRVVILAGALDESNHPSGRVVSLLQQLAAVGIEALTVWCDDETDWIQRGTEMMERGLSLYPEVTAAIGRNGYITLGAYLCCLRVGIAIPERLSLISYGDSSILCSVSPRITAVRTPLCEAAVDAARALIAHIQEGVPLEDHKVWPCTLELRESSRPLAEPDARQALL